MRFFYKALLTAEKEKKDNTVEYIYIYSSYYLPDPIVQESLCYHLNAVFLWCFSNLFIMVSYFIIIVIILYLV